MSSEIGSAAPYGIDPNLVLDEVTVIAVSTVIAERLRSLATVARTLPRLTAEQALNDAADSVERVAARIT